MTEFVLCHDFLCSSLSGHSCPEDWSSCSVKEEEESCIQDPCLGNKDGALAAWPSVLASVALLVSSLLVSLLLGLCQLNGDQKHCCRFLVALPVPSQFIEQLGSLVSLQFVLPQRGKKKDRGQIDESCFKRIYRKTKSFNRLR